MNLSIFLNVIFAGIIAFGVVYNAARVSLSERSRELASLRVLGFTRAEISLILLGELALRDDGGAAGGRAARLWHGGLYRARAGQRGLSLPARLFAGGGRVGVSDHHCRDADLGAGRQAAARPAGSRGRAEDSGVDRRCDDGCTNWRILATLAVVLVILGVALWPESVEVDIARAARPLAGHHRRRRRDPRPRAVLRIGTRGRPAAANRARARRSGRAGKTVLARLTPAQPTLFDARTQAELTAAVEAARAAVGQARAERDRAAAALERVRSLLRRQQELAEAGAISRDELEATQTALKTAEEALRAADFSVNRAEFDLQFARARLQQPGAGGRTIRDCLPD